MTIVHKFSGLRSETGYSIMSNALYLFVSLLFVIEALEAPGITQVSPGHFTTKTTTTTTLTPSSTKSTTTISPTTTIPSTTTIPPTTTTPKRQIVHFVNDSSEVCILLMADIKVILKQENNPNSTREATVVIDEPEADGRCGKQMENIIFYFFKDWKLKIEFSEVNKDSYDISMIQLHYNIDNFPANISLKGLKGDVIRYNITDFGNQNGQSYVCEDGLKVEGAIGGVWNYTLTAEIRNFQVEAFRYNATSTNFNTNGVKNCVNPLANNLIPIIVGTILIALILIVLIVYLISRRKRRAGYESV